MKNQKKIPQTDLVEVESIYNQFYYINRTCIRTIYHCKLSNSFEYAWKIKLINDSSEYYITDYNIDVLTGYTNPKKNNTQ